jgi:hypothetical protein
MSRLNTQLAYFTTSSSRTHVPPPPHKYICTHATSRLRVSQQFESVTFDERPFTAVSSKHTLRVHLFICSLFTNTYSVTLDFRVSNNRMVRMVRMVNDELESTWKRAVMAYWRHYPGICMERLRKTMKHLRQDTLFPGRDFNSGTSENETGVITIQPWRSVWRKTAVTLNIDDVQFHLGGLQVTTDLSWEVTVLCRVVWW